MRLAKAEQSRLTLQKYNKKVRKQIHFTEIVGDRTAFEEVIVYNENTGNVSFSAYFYGMNKHILPVIDIE